MQLKKIIFMIFFFCYKAEFSSLINSMRKDHNPLERFFIFNAKKTVYALNLTHCDTIIRFLRFVRWKVTKICG